MPRQPSISPGMRPALLHDFQLATRTAKSTPVHRAASRPMRNGSFMRRLCSLASLVSGVLMLLTSCRDPAIQRLSAVKQAVCACQTLACADAALQAMPTVPARRLDKAQAVASEIFACYSRLAKADDNAKPATDATDATDAAAVPAAP